MTGQVCLGQLLVVGVNWMSRSGISPVPSWMRCDVSLSIPRPASRREKALRVAEFGCFVRAKCGGGVFVRYGRALKFNQ